MKKFKVAVTDSGREVTAAPDKPALTNLLGILAALTGRAVAQLEQEFVGKGYGDLKRALGEVTVEKLRPIRERYGSLMADRGETSRILEQGAEKARLHSGAIMDLVREKTGLGPLV
jgi:tryptophanyl-tRNA synthetase